MSQDTDKKTDRIDHDIPVEETSGQLAPTTAANSQIAVREPASVPAHQGTPAHKPSRSAQKWAVRIAVLVVALAGITYYFWLKRRPVPVSVTEPVLATITETIASSGRVGGATETLVGAQAQGVVEQLFVKEGDRVTAGQKLAVLKNNVAEAQTAQAQQALQTVRAQLSQTDRGPLASEVNAATEQVRQAEAQVAQQTAAVTQAQKSVAQARAQLDQLNAERELAAKQVERTRTLQAQGVIAQSELDQMRTNLRVAEQRVAAQQQAIEQARSSVRQAEASAKSAQANLGAQQAHLTTVKSGARPEDVQVARQRLKEAEQALQVSRQQAANAIATAPFAGVVTEINTQVGQTVQSQGVLKLVSGESEIRLDVDESNLADLKVGQSAIISSGTFPDTFQGVVAGIGAAVNVARGTVQVRVNPINPPEWLRPGQTVNVNIVTGKDVQRFIVPPGALTRSGDRTVVFVVEDGVALEKPVVTRPPTANGVPILAGINAGDKIILNATSVSAGDSVRIKPNDKGSK